MFLPLSLNRGGPIFGMVFALNQLKMCEHATLCTAKNVILIAKWMRFSRTKNPSWACK